MSRLIEKMVESYLERMSLEEKEALLEKVVAHFFDPMTIEEKQRLIETMLPKLLDGVDTKALLSNLIKGMVKGGDENGEHSGVMDSVSKFANATTEKITNILPDRMKNWVGIGTHHDGEPPVQKLT